MRSIASRAASLVVVAACVAAFLLSGSARAQELPGNLPYYLQDRGTGVSSSMFGTYVRKGEVVIYPFFEFYHDRNFEYEPFDFGFGVQQEFRGIYRADEELIFFGYGISDRAMVEIEASTISATFTRSPLDTITDQTIKESGLGDVEGQLRWRWKTETEGRPEIFSYHEITGPTASDHVLIGTPDWEFKNGIGFIKGYRWGTMTYRVSLGYSKEETAFEVGEYAVEYLKRLSPHWRVYLGVEGSEDEIELIGEMQWHISRNVFLKINNGVGLTSKATDWAPEVGIVFVFPTRSEM